MGRRTNAEVVSYSRWDAFSRIGVASHNVADRWPGRVLRTCSEIDIGRSRRCSKRVVMRPTHWYAWSHHSTIAGWNRSRVSPNSMVRIASVCTCVLLVGSLSPAECVVQSPVNASASCSGSVVLKI